MESEASEERGLAEDKIWPTRYFSIPNFDLAKSASQRKESSHLQPEPGTIKQKISSGGDSSNQQRSHRGPAYFHAFTLPHHQVQSPAISHTDTH